MPERMVKYLLSDFALHFLEMYQMASLCHKSTGFQTKSGAFLTFRHIFRVQNGYVTSDGKVVLNINAAKALNSVVGHEITHVLEGTELYNELQEAVKQYARTKGEYDSRLKAITDLYAKHDPNADPVKELTADLVGDYLFTDDAFITTLHTKHRNIFQKIYDEIKYLCKTVTAGSKEARQLEKVKKAFEKVWRESGKGMVEGTQYSLNANAKTELHKALYDTKYRGEVLLRDETPAIMLAQKGVKNLPMAMNASHIRENVFTEAEAKKLGIKVDKHTHYHGLGEDFFLKVIDGLDNVKLAYRGTKNAKNPSRRENYFLLVSEFKDKAGKTVNVPVYIDEHAQVNRVFIDANKISTVFGRDAFQDYIKRQIQNSDLVRIKNRDIKTSERDTLIVPGYGKDASPTMISQENLDVKHSLSGQGSSEQEGARFSLSEAVEETSDLLALHNLTEAQIRDALSRDSLLMPSIAVTNQGFSNFGEISAVFHKNTIDPNAFLLCQKLDFYGRLLRFLRSCICWTKIIL